jgi:hypothetical protein
MVAKKKSPKKNPGKVAARKAQPRKVPIDAKLAESASLSAVSYYAIILDRDFVAPGSSVQLAAYDPDKSKLEAATEWDPAAEEVFSDPPLPKKTVFRASVQLTEPEKHNLKNLKTLQSVAAHIYSVNEL